MFFYTMSCLTLAQNNAHLDNVALLVDLSDGQMSQINPRIPQKIFAMLQEIMPIRLTNVYVVKQPWWFRDVLFKVRGGGA